MPTGASNGKPRGRAARLCRTLPRLDTHTLCHLPGHRALLGSGECALVVVCPMNLDDIREILCNKHTRARALMDMPHVFFSRSRLRSALCA
jgi:hypothetical protein